MVALEARGVRKTYGGVVALKAADFAVRPGSVHALLGENGAGKSTLVKIMTGAVQPDEGSIRLSGEQVSFRNTAQAFANGVAVVAQELSLFPHLDILDNMFPLREPRRGPFISRAMMRDLAVPVLEELGIERNIYTPVAELSLAERQLVEIAKALVSNPKVLLLDEPTSALETGASDRLLKILRILRDRQVGVVYVSHILEEVMSLCDEVTILRDGNIVVSSASMARMSMDMIVNEMLGKAADAPKKPPAPRTTAPVVLQPRDDGKSLRVENVSSRNGLHDVSFSVRPGEVVGLAGLVGSGPEAMLAAIAGLNRISSGAITLPGGQTQPASPRQAIAYGIAYVSGDRRKLGLMLDKPIWENIVQVRSVGMARDGAWLKTRSLRERASSLATRVGVRTKSVLNNAGSLSGGNQQKVVLAKWLDWKPSTILLNDPTRGVDIGAREEINQLLRQSAADGAVVVYLSTDPAELATGCDRVLVFHRGTICGELSGEALTPSALLQLMNSGTENAA
ncbi:sugar ABC transporter ATP-binding protein [Devosia sp. 919]|uniref:sugar ABC transporter ATP-binding protein n=1 Tax=Devosia sp. 919 TaxID=2726065 RepID=UPI00155616AF|nr:sugar ABC transporter ATP-binding protein [Devosia sp. 919]